MDRYSRMQELSRRMGESVNDLSSIESTLDSLARESETLLLQQSRVNTELQDGLMRTRMVPFASLVPRLRRLVRQPATELGREARISVEGAQGEMDRTVLDRLVAPLEHMLRNAVGHGLDEIVAGGRGVGFKAVGLHGTCSGVGGYWMRIREQWDSLSFKRFWRAVMNSSTSASLSK